MTSTDPTETVVLLVHDSPLGTLAIPTPDGRLFVAERGVSVAIPADVAGIAPGPWESLADGVEPDPGDGRLWRIGDDGWSVRTPGAGLLAQEDVWRLAPAAPKTTTPRKD